MVTEQPLARVGCDAIALKPTECDVSRGIELDIDTVVIDYEGREHLPSAETLRTLTERATVYLTTPVRADGFDPLDDNSLVEWIPNEVGRIFVAGNSAYLNSTEQGRAIAPRLRAALDGYRYRYRSSVPASASTPTSATQKPWVGTEGIERLALAAGGVQYDLLSQHTLETVRAFRSVGYDGEIAVYAPTVLSDDDDAILDALGGYVARRQVVRQALDEIRVDDTAETAPVITDRYASGRTRDLLLTAARDFALVGDNKTVHERITALHNAGVNTVVAYPANGIKMIE